MACTETEAKPGPTPCPADCSSRGVCVDTPGGGAACVCAPGFRGATCERENACPSACSLHGLCLDGLCVCAPGFAGRACEKELPIPPGAQASASAVDATRRCPNRCWGRGAWNLTAGATTPIYGALTEVNRRVNGWSDALLAHPRFEGVFHTGWAAPSKSARAPGAGWTR